jgi:AraC-like DNA-binding protein
MNELVPSRVLTSDDPRFWSHRVGVMFETEFATDDPFAIRVQSTQIGRAIVSDMQTSPFFYARRSRKIRLDMLDNVMLRVDVEPTGPRLKVIDFGQELDDYAPISQHNVSVILSRDTAREIIGDPSRHHGFVAPDAGTELLANFMAMLPRYAPHLRQSQADGMATTLFGLIGVALGATSGHRETGRPAAALATLQRAQAIIRASLLEPDLSPDFVARRAGISRSALYRLFEPIGGVALYIRDRRLDHACRLIGDRTETRLIATIADMMGFGSEAHFSRAFRQRFGHSPSEVRSMARERGLVQPTFLSATPTQPFVSWLHAL